MHIFPTKALTGIALLLMASGTWAQSFVCPNTFQTVMPGFTTAQVANACGVPTRIVNHTAISDRPAVQEQWVYTLRNPLSQNFNQYFPEMILTFQDDRVIQIASNNQTALSLFMCIRSNQVRIGSSGMEVRQLCGPPSSVNTIETASAHQQFEVTEWAYNFGPNRPEMIFIFHNGQLVEFHMGQIVN